MDPTACLKRFLDASADQDRDEAMEALAELGDWLNMGGFLPQVTKLSDLPTTYQLKSHLDQN